MGLLVVAPCASLTVLDDVYGFVLQLPFQIKTWETSIQSNLEKNINSWYRRLKTHCLCHCYANEHWYDSMKKMYAQKMHKTARASLRWYWSFMKLFADSNINKLLAHMVMMNRSYFARSSREKKKHSSQFLRRVCWINSLTKNSLEKQYHDAAYSLYRNLKDKRENCWNFHVHTVKYCLFFE